MYLAAAAAQGDFLRHYFLFSPGTDDAEEVLLYGADGENFGSVHSCPDHAEAHLPTGAEVRGSPSGPQSLEETPTG